MTATNPTHARRRRFSSPVVFTPGDSLTEGAIPIPDGDDWIYEVEGGWRVPLFGAMTDAGLDPQFIGTILNSSYVPPVTGAGAGHNGFGGASAHNWLISYWDTYFPALFPTVPPDLILLSVGANDGNTVGTADDVGGLIDKAAADAPQALIFVANVLPRALYGNDVVNPAIAAAVAAREAWINCILVDQAAHFDGVAQMPDGLHCCPGGYKTMGDVWKQHVLGAIA